MARSPQPKGICHFCQKAYAKGGLSRHLNSCKLRNAANTAAKGKAETLYHLRVENAYSGAFWLDLEVRSRAKLQEIDHYLRAIWLECCGHMSQFVVQAWGDELTMAAKVGTVFEQFDQLTHQYDFGSTTETVVKRVAVRQGAPLSKHPIYLMARNVRPDAPFQVCGDSADYICMECVYEEDETGMLCAKHLKTHPHDDYGPPHDLLNSPRVGMCGELMGDEPPY